MSNEHNTGGDEFESVAILGFVNIAKALGYKSEKSLRDQLSTDRRLQKVVRWNGKKVTTSRRKLERYIEQLPEWSGSNARASSVRPCLTRSE